MASRWSAVAKHCSPVTSDDAYPHVWVTNSSVVRRKNDIRKQRQGRPEAGGWTVHGCDNRLLDFQQVHNDLGASLNRASSCGGVRS